MRLVCPNCTAQYDVGENAIPEGGRDVQCSSCGHTWMQHLPGHEPTDPASAPAQQPRQAGRQRAPAEAPAPESAATRPHDRQPPEAPVDAPAAPRRRAMDPAVEEILRSEAVHAAAKTPDQQETDIWGEAETGARDAPRPGARQGIGADEIAAAPQRSRSGGSRRDLLPNIDEINSSLRSASDRSRKQRAQPEPAPRRDNWQPGSGRRAGFRIGFVLAGMVFLTLTVVYLQPSRVIETVPEAEPQVTILIEKVDNARVWLDDKARTGMNALIEIIAALRG